ncbi:MAG: 2-iminoacetate synthase ThiH [Proteobacteria bacterium]|nr:2-iminoacetate synthase ThiH [Pseudomonadota bacterium]MBU1390023.1 2-iminoacetate synthase ThiH [Pseudomonadota bacterium]MBU1545026.1 2-iminoacetate synthase ThiH [Pseudomonadota bacterium]MBU2480370.1 2-iminoacetate synthase ThiH [Pseudomonadota bacterium]
MSFMDVVKQFESFDFNSYFKSVSAADVLHSLNRDLLSPYDLLNLLSEPALQFLEQMAQKSQKITRQYFGRTIGMYAPLYISDYCSNHCTYCGFNCASDAKRLKLTIDQIKAEAQVISDMGIRHILVLTGEAPEKTPMSYLIEAVEVLKTCFSSIGIEMFPMDEEDYRQLKDAGVDSLTVYQETYDQQIYKQVHLKGKKMDYQYRLLTPERGARAGFRSVNIGPLFGLGEPGSEAFMAGLHAKYLEQTFPDVEISLSLPRMTKAAGGIAPRHTLSDRRFVQFILAWRLFMPRLGITVSTRESARFRDKLLHLGVTRYSAGSKTDVGGYALKDAEATAQFEVTDTRTVDEVTQMIRENGFQPVFKDWEIF